MKRYKGYTIKAIKRLGYYEIYTEKDKYLKNATTLDDAKEKIDLLER